MSSSLSDEEMLDSTPPELEAEANLAIANLLPARSTVKYLKTFENFMAWREQKKAKSFSQKVLLAYFSELAKDKQPSTLWATYSMLKSTMQLKHNINIKNYTALVSFLRRQSVGFKSKKSKILTDENISKFLNEAPDDVFLVTKVALIFGVNGACRMIELINLTIHDVTCHDDIMLVKLREYKADRTFVIGQGYVPLIKKYQALRPSTIKSDRFFINFKNGKCTSQVIGRHKMAEMPSQIAKYLNLPDSECFTGHCFRQSSATLLANSGANLTTLKRHEGRKSSIVPDSYIEDSMQNRKDISERINQTIKLEYPIENDCQSNFSDSQPSTSKQNTPKCPESLSYTEPYHMPYSNKKFNISSTPSTTDENIQQINITMPGKTVILNFTDCPNMSNISLNFKLF